MIYLGSDHGGFALKQQLKKYLDSKKIKYEDVGAYSEDVDNNVVGYAFDVANKVKVSKENKGILVCGNGVGMSIAVNRIKGIRGALCRDTDTAKLAREHNDANVLVLGGRVTSASDAIDVLEIFFTTEFLGGKYAERISKLDV